MVAALALAFLGVPLAATAQTVVTPANLGVDWFNTTPLADTRPGGAATFGVGPGTPPLGVGSLQIRSYSAAAKAQMANGDLAGTPLADITSLGYDTYRSSLSTSSAVALPAINIPIDINGGVLNPGEFATLVFEPVYNIPPQPAIASDVWQHWDAFNGGNAVWWSTRNIPGVCQTVCYVSWATILANNPNATILGVIVNFGSGTSNTFIGAVDNLSTGVNGNVTTYDFEPTVNTLTVSNVQPNGWAFVNEGATGAGSFVTGPPVPPLGDGSANLIVDGTGRENVAAFTNAGTRLDQITNLSYWTYRATPDPGNLLAIALQFDIDADAADTTNTYMGRIVFEPYLTPGVSGTIVSNTWRQWSPLNGVWYLSRANVTVGDVLIANPCTQAAPCTWSQIMQNFPNAGIWATGIPGINGGLGGPTLLRAGGPWTGGFSGNVDALLIEANGVSTTFNFQFEDPRLSLTKTANAASFNAAGQSIGYQMVATNTGNVTLTNVSITDPGVGVLTCTSTGAPAVGQPVTLAPGQTLTCAGTHVVTQADVDGGGFTNTANASGSFDTPPIVQTINAPPAQVVVPAIQTPSLALTKSSTPTNFDAVGQVITYTMVATNTGNVTLAGVTITDPLPAALACTSTGIPAVGQPVTLAPGRTLTCTGTYAITQADFDNGFVTNTAAAAGTFNANPVLAPTATLLLPRAVPVTTETRVAFTTCSADLRQDWIPVWTKLQFDVWNEDEIKFTGAFECSDSWHETDFGQSFDSAQQNFTRDVVGTLSARYRVQAVTSTQCPGARATGLLGVQSMQLQLPLRTTIGSMLVGAGKMTGSIRWDPAGVVPEVRSPQER